MSLPADAGRRAMNAATQAALDVAGLDQHCQEALQRARVLPQIARLADDGAIPRIGYWPNAGGVGPLSLCTAAWF